MNFEEITKLYDFSGKSVLLTGGAGVLTGKIACAMFGCNANIAIIDRDPALAETVMKRLEPVGDRAIVVYGDVLQPETMQQALAQVIRAFGKVDYLVNGAGGEQPKGNNDTVHHVLRSAAGSAPIRVRPQFVGTIIPSQVIGRHMAERKEGVV